MGFENYISESEAATVAGVGVSTLRRFAEAGYFTVETESDGLKLYPRTQIEKVFGVSRHNPAPPIPEAQNIPEQLFDDTEVQSTQASCATAQPTPKIEVARPSETIKATETTSSIIEKTEKIEQNTEQLLNRNHQVALNKLEQELHRGKVISEMQERLILIREEEIRSLKDEREWLRARIEKLEEKASRDQLLLLSETQTIKALITIQEHRRSPFRAALEWFGFIEPSTPNLALLDGKGTITVKDESLDKQQTKRAA